MESNDEGVSLADVTVINDMETQSNTVVDTENTLTESKIMDDTVSHSTPIQSKKPYGNDMMRYLCSMMCSMKENSENKIQCYAINLMNKRMRSINVLMETIVNLLNRM